LERIALEFLRGDHVLLWAVGLDRFLVTRLGNRSIRRQEGHTFWQVVERNGVEYVQKYWYLEEQRRYIVLYHRELVRSILYPYELGPWNLWSTSDTRIENEWNRLNLQELNTELSEARIAIEEQGHYTRSGRGSRK